MPKRKPVAKSVEDIYCSKLFVPPKEKNLETIFEEPRQSKDGNPVLTSVKKYKRYLHFDPPSQNKIQKRKQKAKKCLKKLKLNRPVTRSSPENSKSNDISLYMSDILGDSSSDSDMEVSFTSKATPEIAADTQISNINSAISERSASLNELCATPKRNYYERRPSVLLQRDTDSVDETEKNCDTEKSGNNLQIDAKKSEDKNAAETVESPRRSCCIS